MRSLLFILVMVMPVLSNAQPVPVGLSWNKELSKQLLKNQAVRVSSEYLFQDRLFEQKKLYNKVGERVTEILIIHQFIYDKLSNVNSLLKQGKKMRYFTRYITEITENAGVLLSLIRDNPEYAVLYTQSYSKIVEQCMMMVHDVQNVILKEDGKVLMDPYDREILVEKLLSRARSINGNLTILIYQLKNASKIAYYKQIPILNYWVSLDREIVRSIMTGSNQLIGNQGL